ncbi:hypothetical protein Anas_12802, partial [Armadillidium nasatum]
FTHKIIFKMRLVYSTVIATFLFASFVASVPRDYDQQNRTLLNTLKDKSFRDMFEDSKTVARRLDENVGEWLDTKSSNVEEFKK